MSLSKLTLMLLWRPTTGCRTYQLLFPLSLAITQVCCNSRVILCS